MRGCIVQAGVDGFAHIETASVMQFVKLHTTMGRANGNGSDGFNVLGILDHVANERAIAAIVPLIDDPVPRVRRRAVHALGCLGCKPTAGPLPPIGILDRITRQAENDTNQKVRGEACLALAYRARAAVPALKVGSVGR
jgi:hypothetical protein